MYTHIMLCTHCCTIYGLPTFFLRLFLFALPFLTIRRCLHSSPRRMMGIPISYIMVRSFEIATDPTQTRNPGHCRRRRRRRRRTVPGRVLEPVRLGPAATVLFVQVAVLEPELLEVVPGVQVAERHRRASAAAHVRFRVGPHVQLGRRPQVGVRDVAAVASAAASTVVRRSRRPPVGAARLRPRRRTGSRGRRGAYALELPDHLRHAGRRFRGRRARSVVLRFGRVAALLQQ